MLGDVQREGYTFVPHITTLSCSIKKKGGSHSRSGKAFFLTWGVFFLGKGKKKE